MLGTSSSPDNCGRAESLGPKIVDRSAVMYDAMVGEHIARIQARPNVQDEAGAETLKGLLWTPPRVRARRAEQGKAMADRYSGTPAGSAYSPAE
jgi:hypothetical protein